MSSVPPCPGWLSKHWTILLLVVAIITLGLVVLNAVNVLFVMPRIGGTVTQEEFRRAAVHTSEKQADLERQVQENRAVLDRIEARLKESNP